MEKLELMLQLAPMEKIGTNTTRDTKESPFLFEMHRAGYWSERYEHFARFLRRGTIYCMPLYAQACNANFSGRLDTKDILLGYVL